MKIDSIFPGQNFSTDIEFIGESICTICLRDFVIDDKVRLIPCSHLFHKMCIDE